MTGRPDASRSMVDAVTDAAIAALLPADRRLPVAAAEHRDRAHVAAAVDRLLPRVMVSEVERARVRLAALDRLAVSRADASLPPGSAAWMPAAGRDDGCVIARADTGRDLAA